MGRIPGAARLRECPARCRKLPARPGPTRKPACGKRLCPDLVVLAGHAVNSRLNLIRPAAVRQYRREPQANPARDRAQPEFFPKPVETGFPPLPAELASSMKPVA